MVYWALARLSPLPHLASVRWLAAPQAERQSSQAAPQRYRMEAHPTAAPVGSAEALHCRRFQWRLHSCLRVVYPVHQWITSENARVCFRSTLGEVLNHARLAYFREFLRAHHCDFAFVGLAQQEESFVSLAVEGILVCQ